jgi:hypothetical protein
LLFKAKPEQYDSLTEFYMAYFGVIIMILASIFYIGNWPDIGIDDEGILVEFIWGYLRVLWSDITSIKHVGSNKFGVWLITTNNRLTFLHRVYSLWTSFSFEPGFIIHTQSAPYREALKVIQKYRNSHEQK